LYHRVIYMRSIFRFREIESTLVKENLTKLIENLLKKIDGKVAILFTKDGLSVLVYPENIVAS